ncbi:MAG: histidine kinase dimerization/phosphoacceptor domain -containing protein [Rhizobiaceae bacterium]
MRLLQVGSILLPALALVLWATFSWQRHVNQTLAMLSTEVELLREYSLRVIETQVSLLVEAERLLGDTDVRIASQAEIHDTLSPLIGRLKLTLGVGVISPSGDVVGSTTYPISGSAADRAYFEHFRDGRGTIFIERVIIAQSGVSALLVAKRLEGEAFNGAVVAAVDVEAVTDFFARVANEDGMIAELVSSKSAILLRYPSVSLTTLPPESPLAQEAAVLDSGIVEATSRNDGVTRFYAFTRLENFPAFAVFATSRSAIFWDWFNYFLLVVGIVATGAALAFAATTQAIRRVASEEQQKQLAFDHQLLEEAQKAAEMRAQLLREAHHRIKNNLQMVVSLVRSKRIPGRTDALEDVENRVQAIAQVHDLLYHETGGGSDIDLSDLSDLIDAICRNPSIIPPERNIEIQLELEPCPTHVARAVPLALVVVEIITNSLKHAFPDEREGRIDISLSCANGLAVLTISDNGTGLSMPEGRKRNSGLKLVEAFISQCNGTLEMSAEQGTRFHITFPQEAVATEEHATTPPSAASPS